jgi:N-acetylglucosamine malate deacetylase 1
LHILAIGAHPDDLEIFAYGVLASWAAMGARLTLVIATDGSKGGTLPAAELSALRQQETTSALAPLGAGAPVMLGFPDGALRADAALEQALQALIQTHAPDLVLTHAPNDYHADHRALSAGVLQAAGFSVPVLYMDTMNGTGFVPTHWVDVTPHWFAKETAIRAHATQDPERFVLGANRQAGFRAGECNAPPTHRAEAFRFEPRFPFADIRALIPPAPPLRPVGDRGTSAKT